MAVVPVHSSMLALGSHRARGRELCGGAHSSVQYVLDRMGTINWSYEYSRLQQIWRTRPPKSRSQISGLDASGTGNVVDRVRISVRDVSKLRIHATDTFHDVSSTRGD